MQIITVVRYSLALMVGMATTFFRLFSVSCYGIFLFKLFRGRNDVNWLEEKDLKCIIKQLSDSVFVICKIINLSVRVI